MKITGQGHFWALNFYLLTDFQFFWHFLRLSNAKGWYDHILLDKFQKRSNVKRQFPKDGVRNVVVWCVHGEPLTAFYLTRSPKGNDCSSESRVRG